MDSSEKLLKELQEILLQFENTRLSQDVRDRVLSLIPAFDKLRELGKSIIPNGLDVSAGNRLLSYFLMYPRIVLNEKELALVAGISEWARRVRELRVQFGWKIITGMTARQMLNEEELSEEDIKISKSEHGKTGHRRRVKLCCKEQ